MNKKGDGLTLERLSRLYRMSHVLARGPVDKTTILERLGVGPRTFYRDLITLESFGMPSIRTENGYCLTISSDEIEEKLPFPDPKLNFADARKLANSQNPAARRIAEQFGLIFPDLKSSGTR